MSQPPLAGVRVVEFAGLAPVPFAGLILSDFGASVVRIDRQAHQAVTNDVLCRGKRSIAINLKSEEGLDVVRKLILSADVLLDPFRPGVLEKMGLGPEVWLGEGDVEGKNERLVFARIAGYNRDSVNKDVAGHDINYLAMSGALSLLPGTPDKPTFPLNLLADFAGGGLTCAMGIVLALMERVRSGRGQVVEADMVSGTRYLSTYPFIHNALHSPLFASVASPRQLNVLDSGAPFYNVYTCADRQPIAVGCIEPQFFKIFLEHFYQAVPKEWLEVEEWKPGLGIQAQKELWPKFRELLDRGFKLKTRDEWVKVFEGTDACVTPVLTPAEAAVAYSYISAPAPTLSRTPANKCDRPISVLSPGEHSREILAELGLPSHEIEKLVRAGVVSVKDSVLAKL
ncbi:CoA-transferase family III domain-containing protein [Vararia minispora EC-137]|uniref:CoA-transferase family III domain-containing protein n=1 Tax=Vararia minispora EC-137 TaxID=1314806 RepID=A0ACB8QVF1_9AGAM|nr:CoA-transferase family III domain-containing protein [Vararia minispora EC-137]